MELMEVVLWWDSHLPPEVPKSQVGLYEKERPTFIRTTLWRPLVQPLFVFFVNGTQGRVVNLIFYLPLIRVVDFSPLYL